MSGQYKLLRNDGGDTPVRKRSGHKTFTSAVIELGRDARKNTQRDLSYQIRHGDVILLSKAGADARAVRTDDPQIKAWVDFIELRARAYD